MIEWYAVAGLLARESGSVFERDIVITTRAPEPVELSLACRIDPGGETRLLAVRHPGGEASSSHFVPVARAGAMCTVSRAVSGRPTPENRRVAFAPSAPFDIYLVMHTHTDLGFTQPQFELLDLHLEFIDQAVAYAQETAHRPEEERFRWTCEVSWAVEEYVRRRPAQAVKELSEQLRGGAIELTGLYVNQTDLMSFEEMHRSTRWGLEAANTLGVEIRSAQNSDVNGIAWGFVPLLHEAGIRQLAMAVNPVQGQTVFPERCPHAFLWRGTDGSEILVWNGEHYCQGNALGLLPPAKDAPERVSAHFARLIGRGYRHRFGMLALSGVSGDNRPPNVAICDVVRDWNGRFVSPRLRTATLSDFFGRLRAEAVEFPSERGIWANWWANGTNCTPPETALSRHAQALLQAAGALAAATPGASPTGETGSEIERLYRQNVIFDEHTWGGHNANSAPWEPYHRMIWNWKAGHVYAAWHGALRLCRSLLGRSASGVPCEILVFNQHTEPFGGPVEVWVYRRGRAAFRGDYAVVDEEGRELPAEWIGGSDWAKLLVELEIEPLSIRRLRVVGGRKGPPCASGAASESNESGGFAGGSLTGRFFRLAWDGTGVRSLVSLARGRELLDAESPFRFGACILERPQSEKGKDPREALFSFGSEVHFLRQAACLQRAEIVAPGNGRSTLRLHASLPGFNFVTTDVTLYDSLPRIDIAVSWEMPSSYEPLAVYIVFPFALREPEVYLDLPGVIGRPGKEQLAGSCEDWYSVQDWVAVCDAEGGVVVASTEAPVFQFGGLRTCGWNRLGRPRNGTVVSWPLHSHTLAPPEPRQQFHYSVTAFPGPFRPKEATHFARSAVRPPLAFYYPEPSSSEQVGHAGEAVPRAAPGDRRGPRLRIEPGNVLLEALSPSRAGGASVRLRELSGSDTEAAITARDAAAIYRTDVAGRRLTAFDKRGERFVLRLPAFASVGCEIVWNWQP